MFEDMLSRMIRTRDTFEAVLNNHDDQVIVRQLLKGYIPDDVKLEIVWRFNLYICERNLRVIRIASEGPGVEDKKKGEDRPDKE